MAPSDVARAEDDALVTIESGRPAWMDRLLRLDLVTWVLSIHALGLLALGQVAIPELGFFVAACLPLWRIVLNRLARRTSGRQKELIELAIGIGSLLLAGVMLVADGGTESPFFFWPLIMLGWQALIHPLSRFALLAGVAVVAYLVVVAVVPDLTPASVGRLGLLLAFVGILSLGRLRLEEGEAEAERAGRLLRDAFWTAPVGFAVLDGEPPEVVYANQSAHSMRLFAGSDGLALASLARAVRETGESVGPELVTIDSGAASRHFRILATPHKRNGGTAVVVCAEDVTSQVSVGEERRRFLQLASHQLRTPLTPIIGYAELLREGRLEQADLAEAVEAILNAGKRLDRLFERMASVVRLQHEPGRDCRQATMGGILEELREVDPEVLEGVLVSGDPEDELRCHPPSVAVALREVLDNGHRFGVPPVRLSWARSGHSVSVSVTDAGDGPVAEGEESDPFGEWGQGGELNVMPSGMGTRLGLLQARLLVDLAGGELELIRDGGDWAFVMTFTAAGPGRRATSAVGVAT